MGAGLGMASGRCPSQVREPPLEKTGTIISETLRLGAEKKLEAKVSRHCLDVLICGSQA